MKKPVPKIKIVSKRVCYWDCGNPKHSHLTEDVAQRCIGKFPNRGKSQSKSPHAGRNFALAEGYLRQGNASALGRQYGISSTRANQIINLYVRIAKRVQSGHYTEHNTYGIYRLVPNRYWLWVDGLAEKLLATSIGRRH